MATNYTIPRGELWFAAFLPGTKTPGGSRFLGNAPEFGISFEAETLDHFSSTRGVKQKDDSHELQRTGQGSMVLDDIQFDNLALYMAGEAGVISQSSATAVEETLEAVQPGLTYRLGVSDANPTGVRSISDVVVEVGVSTKTAGTDYTVDEELGRITIVEGGTIAADADVVVTYDHAAVSRRQIVSGSATAEGVLTYISYNEKGLKIDWELPWAKLSPNGDLGLITEEWQTIPLSVEILKLDNREMVYADGRPFTP